MIKQFKIPTYTGLKNKLKTIIVPIKDTKMTLNSKSIKIKIIN